MTRGIVFTGGGTAGHVTPNIPLIDEFINEGWKVDYIGSAGGVEQDIISQMDIAFHAVSSGKLRRYASWQNMTDPFKIFWGMIQSWFLLKRLKPQVVFSKGGFVAVPVVVAAWLNRIPVVAHESDMSPGLANKLCFPFVKKICLTFEAATTAFKDQQKIAVTGTPIRQQILNGNKARGLAVCQFKDDKPCLLVMGGSMGANSINHAIRDALPELSKQFQVIHLCGKGKINPVLEQTEGYKQFEYADKDLADLFAASDIIVSRAGANALYEILALGKPHILIPLSKKASRGDQIQNAAYFCKQGISQVIEDELLKPDRLITSLNEIMKNKDALIEKIKRLNIQSATPQIVAIIKEQANA